jgi:hypothetical protein
MNLVLFDNRIHLSYAKRIPPSTTSSGKNNNARLLSDKHYVNTNMVPFPSFSGCKKALILKDEKNNSLQYFPSL